LTLQLDEDALAVTSVHVVLENVPLAAPVGFCVNVTVPVGGVVSVTVAVHCVANNADTGFGTHDTVVDVGCNDDMMAGLVVALEAL
jgi:hypothetical protein